MIANKKSLFDLPRDILSLIYEYDNTFKKVFSTEESRKDIRRMSQNIKQTSECIKQFIKNELVSIPGMISVGPEWGYVSRNPFFWIPSEIQTFGTEFLIFLYPKEEQYTKYQIIRRDIDPITIDLNEFDGFVCNEEQHSYFMNLTGIIDYFDSHIYKYNGMWMKVSNRDIETGLYLHTIHNYLDNYESDEDHDDILFSHGMYENLDVYDGYDN